jgi:hypothetical protein
VKPLVVGSWRRVATTKQTALLLGRHWRRRLDVESLVVQDDLVRADRGARELSATREVSPLQPFEVKQEF